MRTAFVQSCQPLYLHHLLCKVLLEDSKAIPNLAIAWNKITNLSYVYDLSIRNFCRMAGMVRSVSKFPTYRRMFRQVVKDLVAYSSEKEASTSSSMRSITSIDNV